MDFRSKQCSSLRRPHSHTERDRRLSTHTFNVGSLTTYCAAPPGTAAELRDKSEPQTDKFEDILKDRPMKYSLRREGLRLQPIPPLGVVWNWDRERGCGQGDREGVFQPGDTQRRSLSRDGNVVPLQYQRTQGWGSEGWRERHDRDFRYCCVACEV